MESQTIGKLSEALSKAQGMMESAKKDSTNPHFKSKYADLASIIDAIKEPLSKNNLSYVQYLEPTEKGMLLVTKLMHSSGEWISGSLPLIITKNDMQGLGSALTYARRYSLSSMVGIAQDDDDGNAASAKPYDEQPQGKPQSGGASVKTTQPNGRPLPLPVSGTHWKMGPDQIRVLDGLGASARLKGWEDMTAMAGKNLHAMTEIEYENLCERLEYTAKSLKAAHHQASPEFEKAVAETFDPRRGNVK